MYAAAAPPAVKPVSFAPTARSLGKSNFNKLI